MLKFLKKNALFIVIVCYYCSLPHFMANFARKSSCCATATCFALGSTLIAKSDSPTVQTRWTLYCRPKYCLIIAIFINLFLTSYMLLYFAVLNIAVTIDPFLPPYASIANCCHNYGSFISSLPNWIHRQISRALSGCPNICPIEQIVFCPDIYIYVFIRGYWSHSWDTC